MVALLDDSVAGLWAVNLVAVMAEVWDVNIVGW